VSCLGPSWDAEVIYMGSARGSRVASCGREHVHMVVSCVLEGASPLWESVLGGNQTVRGASFGHQGREVR
jgi:hypothetical protein